jgi:hypothetical protein
MRRREFIAGLGGAAAWPFVARAQQPVLPIIGYLSPGQPDGGLLVPWRRSATAWVKRVLSKVVMRLSNSALHTINSTG